MLGTSLWNCFKRRIGPCFLFQTRPELNFLIWAGPARTFRSSAHLCLYITLASYSNSLYPQPPLSRSPRYRWRRAWRVPCQPPDSNPIPGSPILLHLLLLSLSLLNPRKRSPPFTVAHIHTRARARNLWKSSGVEAMSGPSREQALSLLAQANNHGDLAVKLSSLKQAKGILASCDPFLAAELFPYLVELQYSPEALVRKSLLEWVLCFYLCTSVLVLLGYFLHEFSFLCISVIVRAKIFL